MYKHVNNMSYCQQMVHTCSDKMPMNKIYTAFALVLYTEYSDEFSHLGFDQRIFFHKLFYGFAGMNDC